MAKHTLQWHAWQPAAGSAVHPSRRADPVSRTSIRRHPEYSHGHFRHPAVIPRPREAGGLRPTRIRRNAYAANQEPEEPRRHRSSAARLYDGGLSLGDGEAESDEEFSEFVEFGRRERQGRGTGVADVHSHDLHHALLDAGLTA